MEDNFLKTEGEAFIKAWYYSIDNKHPFEEISEKTVGQELVVDFPGNPLDFNGFKNWYVEQCCKFTGNHLIHTIQVSGLKNEMEIFSEITWIAKGTDGSELKLYPNVILKLRKEEQWKVYYYGCVDRQ